MNKNGLINSGVMLLLLAAVAPLPAQQEPRERDAQHAKQEKEQAKPQRQDPPQRGKSREERPQQLQPAKPPQEQQRPQQNKGQQEHRPQAPQPRPQQPQQPQRQLPQPLPPRQQRQQLPKPQAREQPIRPQRLKQPVPAPPPLQAQPVRQVEHQAVWPERRAQNWQSEHRDWRQRGGYNGYRIPTARYRGHFGPGHSFRIHSFPVFLSGGFPRFEYGGFWFSILDPWPEYWSDNWYENDEVYIQYSGDGYYLYNRRHLRDRIAITVFLN
ncbi:MAG: hypothetical protein IPP78_11760 [Holophagaceae bacterium]|nr:hypothetical protein [Holophagaceae bacterium]